MPRRPPRCSFALILARPRCWICVSKCTQPVVRVTSRSLQSRVCNPYMCMHLVARSVFAMLTAHSSGCIENVSRMPVANAAVPRGAQLLESGRPWPSQHACRAVPSPLPPCLTLPRGSKLPATSSRVLAALVDSLSLSGVFGRIPRLSLLLVLR